MPAFMAYATLVGLLLSAAASVLERTAPWLLGRRRMVWIGVIGGALVLAVAVTVVPGTVRTQVSPSNAASARAMTSTTANVARVQAAPRPQRADGEAQIASEGTSRRLDSALVAVWIVLSSLCLAVLSVSAWRVGRMRRSWRETVIGGVPVLVSHDVGPAVIGLVHHGIVVPAWVEALSVDEQRTVMTHEREHVRAGDPLLLWGATLLVAIAPWNAALWYALRRLRHAIEMDCDVRVLRTRPDARAYCTLLLDVGERTLAGVAPVAALAEPSTLLERRIDAMTSPVRVHGWLTGAGAVAALLLVAAACWAPRPEVAPRARVAELVTELEGLLANDSTRAALPLAELVDAQRALASGQAVARRTDTGVRATTGTTTTATPAAHIQQRYPYPTVQDIAEERRLVPLIDTALKQSYPQLYARTDTSALLVVLHYDERGVLRANDLYSGPRFSPYRFPDMGSQIVESGERELPGLHATLLLIRERGVHHGVFEHTEPAPQEEGVPPEQDFSRRVDSLAAADFPEVIQPHNGVLVVGVMFSGDGRVLRSALKVFATRQLYDGVPGADGKPTTARTADDLLARLFGFPLPRFRGHGISTHVAAPGTLPHTLFVYGVTIQP